MSPRGIWTPVPNRKLFKEFNRVGVTVLIASHDLSLIATLRHRILTLEHGRMIQGAKEKLVSDN